MKKTAFVMFNLFIFCFYHATARADETEMQKTTVTVSVAGDCTLGYDLTRGYGSSFMDVFYRQNSDYAYFFENVLPVFEADDLSIVNLEGPLTDATVRMDKEFAFKGPPEFTNILKAGSIEAVNLANNHTYDYLQKGYEDTIKHLNEADIRHFGAPDDSVVEVKGIKIGLLGYKGYPKKQIATDVKRLKDDFGAQLVIVSFHWGEELSNYPSSVQKDLGRTAIDAGADLVFGHHPHVMQGIEQYNGKYIVYSLGNFCFGGNRNPRDKDSFIFQEQFVFEDGVHTESSVNVVPVSVSSVKNKNDFKPTPAEGQEARRILERLAVFSKPLNDTDISNLINPIVEP